MNIIELKGITKTYGNNKNFFEALKNINLSISKGDMVAVMGPSGSGKSTLLNILGLMDTPSSGDYYLSGKNCKDLKQNKINKVRNEKIGFIFQNFALLKEYSALDNVILPLTYRKMKNSERKSNALKYLEMICLRNEVNKRPSELSGGQQQRVAIARALVTEPDMILADEPTGNLDHKTSCEIIDLLCEINATGKTIIIVTHDINIANKCKRKINIIDGNLQELA